MDRTEVLLSKDYFPSLLPPAFSQQELRRASLELGVAGTSFVGRCTLLKTLRHPYSSQREPVAAGSGTEEAHAE